MNMSTPGPKAARAGGDLMFEANIYLATPLWGKAAKYLSY